MGVTSRPDRSVPRYADALFVLAVGLGAAGWTVLAGSGTPRIAMFVAAAAAPIALLLAVSARLDRPIPGGSILGGAIVGPIVAIVGHAVVAAFAAAFFLGFADSGRALMDELRIDPRLGDLLASPWVIVLLVDVSVAAPLVEELGKALGARVGAGSAGIESREDAFIAGAAAGAGFAIIENVLYASLGAAFGGPWPAIIVVRSLGAAVHPLATGLVMLGWWNAGRGGGGRAFARGYLSGAGVHAIWNAAVVALFVVQQATDAPSSAGAATMAFTAMLGLIFAGWLWNVVRQMRVDVDPLSAIKPSDVRTLAPWVVLTAASLVPVTFVILAFPSFYER
jgi:RsiW-degrading membrane proteinase PrsW (M82 family)